MAKLPKHITAERDKGWCSFCQRGMKHAVVIVLLLARTRKRYADGPTVTSTLRLGLCLRCIDAINGAAEP